MSSQQLELKSDITNLFEDLESIAKETKVHAPHVPKIEQADITELFSGLNIAHEEAKVEVELRLTLEEKNNLDTFTNLVDTFSEITKPEATWPNEWPEEEYPKQKPIDESVIQSLEELFSTTTHIEPVELVNYFYFLNPFLMLSTIFEVIHLHMQTYNLAACKVITLIFLIYYLCSFHLLILSTIFY